MTAISLHAVPATHAPVVTMISRRTITAHGQNFSDAHTGNAITGATRRTIINLIRAGFVTVDQDTHTLTVTPRGDAGMMLVEIGDLSAAAVAVLARIQQGDRTLWDANGNTRRTLRSLAARRMVRADGFAGAWHLSSRGVIGFAAAGHIQRAATC